jgi:hypothetical protein
MFRIPEFFVKDKDLHKVLTALSGLAINLAAPQPVVNVTIKKGEMKQASSSTTISGRILEAVQKLKGQPLASLQLLELIAANGGSRASLNSVTKFLIVNKAIKRKSRGNFIVL